MFSGLDPGSYQLAVKSRSHKVKMTNFLLTSRGATVDIELTHGGGVIADVRYESGGYPSESEVQLVSRLGQSPGASTTSTTQDPVQEGRWSYEDLASGTWFLQVQPSANSMSSSYPIEVPFGSSESVPFELTLGQPCWTSLDVEFRSKSEIVTHPDDGLVIVVRQTTGELVGTRKVGGSIFATPFEIPSDPIEIGLLFPGTYEVYLYPEPDQDEGDEFWEGAFEAGHRSIVVPKGGLPMTASVSLEWFRKAEPVRQVK